MLKSWSVEHFKPIITLQELNLAPVTVLAGLNSSGKSSLLQSILMISQTLSSRVLDRSLLPNGPTVQLGTFEDILNETSRSRILTVGLELEMGKDESRYLSSARRRYVGGIIVDDRQVVKSAKIIAKFSSASSNGISSSAVEASKVAVESVSLEINCELKSLPVQLDSDFSEHEMKDFKFNLTIKKITRDELKQFLTNVASDYLRLVPYAGEQPNYLGEFKTHDEKIRELYLVTLSHFLPTRLVRKFKGEERRKQRLGRAVELLFDYPNDPRGRIYSDVFDIDAPILEDLKRSVRELCKENSISEEFTGQSLGELIHWFKSLGMRGSRKKTIGKKTQEMIVQHFMQIESENFKNSEGLTDVLELWSQGEKGIQYAIDQEYKKRYQSSVSRPLDYRIGSHFIESIKEFGLDTNGIFLDKVVRAAAATIADQVKDIKGYKLHPLRKSETADSPQRIRSGDNAKAWRLMIEKRGAGWRLHYWQVPGLKGNMIEFSNVEKESGDRIYE